MSGFFALLDDIATLAKLTLSTLDDTASMAVKTSVKVSAAAVDDVAATPQYVTGITADREIPIIKKITLGSLRNKLLIILPIGLLLTWLAPGLLPVALVIGGSYLCFEGGEKVAHAMAARLHPGAHAPAAPEAATEAGIVRRAITTDFVLSTEIMLLALAEVEADSSLERIITLVLVAFFITFCVYGLVAALIKADDLGLRLARAPRSATQRLGRGIVTAAPHMFDALGIIGTVAMLWVGGEILAHNLDSLGWAAPEHLLEAAAHLAHQPVVSWILMTATAAAAGLVYGVLLTGLVAALRVLLAPVLRRFPGRRPSKNGMADAAGQDPA